MKKQNYEEYWKLTVEYTDINSNNFIETLRIIVDFIDENSQTKYTKEGYKKLQNLVYDCCPKVDMGSIRKSINQFVKLGFINPKLESYNNGTKEFLEALTNRKRNIIFSKVFYSFSTFNSSVTNSYKRHEINFIIKTLEEVGKLSKDEITALMLIDISEINKGYLTKEELEEANSYAKKIDFKIRKYNQVGYLFGFLKKLNDIAFVNNELYFKDDAKNIFGEELKEESRKRDSYLHRLYKNQLKEESEEQLGNVKCMVENLPYPSLVASHIKPFIVSDDNEAYDPNNGLLLSRNMDILFDQGYISFDNNGTIIYSNQLHQEVIAGVSKYFLYDVFINSKRLEYLAYHREIVLKK